MDGPLVGRNVGHTKETVGPDHKINQCIAECHSLSGALQNSGVFWSAGLECNPHEGVLSAKSYGVQNSTPVCCTPFGHILTMNNSIYHN